MKIFAVVTGLVLAVMCALPAAAQAGKTEARILESKKLMVCIWPDYYGITYRNPASSG